MAATNLLDECRIPSIPDSMFYVANFLTPEQETSILNALPPNRWIQLQHRRLQTHPCSLSKSKTLLEAPLPQWLIDPVVGKFKSLGLFGHSPHQAPNHVLINEYKPREGIMPHEDGAAYFPIVATVSLSSTLCLDIYEKSLHQDVAHAASTVGSRCKWRVLQEPRSLLVTCGSAYTHTLHGISEIDVDEDLGANTVANWSLLGDSNAFVEAGGKNKRETRISLTYRDVLKVSRLGAKILGKARG
jgi:alkylated DNA repair protein alkB family protein 6